MVPDTRANLALIILNCICTHAYDKLRKKAKEKKNENFFLIGDCRALVSRFTGILDNKFQIEISFFCK